MAKFFISNSLNNVDLIERHNKMYPVNGMIETNSFKAVLFDKMSQHHVDSKYVTAGGGAFVVGTPLLREGIKDCSIAEYIFTSFDGTNISKIKVDVVGYWAAMVVKEGKAYIFNDYYGIYDICYMKDEESFCIGNKLHDVVRCAKNIELEEYSFILEAFQHPSFEGMTAFKNIYRVKSDEYLIVEESNVEIINFDILPITYIFKSEDKAVTDISDMITKYAKIMSDKYGPVAIGMTGGLDSRLMFGAFYAAGADITCMHGVSSATRIEDREIVEKISTAYNKPLKYYDWEQPTEFDLESQKEVFEEFGFSNNLALGCKAHLYQFKKNAEIYPFYQSGYFCEAIRLRDWAENKGRSFSLSDFIDDYFINKDLRDCYAHYDGYREFLIGVFKEQLSKMGIEGDYENIPIDCFERFRWYKSRFDDSRSVVNHNMYGFQSSLLAIPYIHEAILSLPADVIRNGSFQIKVLERLDSNLITFDVFSHERPYYIKNYRKVLKTTRKNIADRLLSYTPGFRRLLVKIYHNYRYSAASKNNEMLNQIIGMQISFPNYIKIDEYKGSLINLRALAIGLYCMKH